MDNVTSLIPVHERRILEAHVRKISLSKLSFVTTELNEYESAELKDLIRMRHKGIPLQYLIGNQAFYGREFYINTSVLIPRPETEGLVETALEHLFLRPGKKIGLELGVGSGCISLTLCIENPEIFLFASDISADALGVCDENRNRFHVQTLNTFQVSSELSVKQYTNVPELDFIISNPPYLLKKDEISAEVLEYEPEDALFDFAEDGLGFYRFLGELCNAKLKQDGIAFFEIAHNRSEEVQKLFSEFGFSTKIRNDLTNRPRYIVVSKKD